MTAVVRRIADAFRTWRAQRPVRLRVSGVAFLAGGDVVHVVDVDRRRIVFVTGRHGACLLDAYPQPPGDVTVS